jgi:hypothetical protein
MHRNAAVASAMVVTAFKALAEVPEQNGAGVEQRATGITLVRERSFNDGCNREAFVLFLERSVAGAARAYILSEAPISAVRDHSGVRRSTADRGARFRQRQIPLRHAPQNSNFSQV